MMHGMPHGLRMLYIACDLADGHLGVGSEPAGCGGHLENPIPGTQ